MNTAKKRSDNWRAEDKMLLQELVKERVAILENKHTDTNTNNRKIAAWADLRNSFNIMRNGAERSVTQLKNQWGALKSAEKRQITAERKARLVTGGGPPPPEDPITSNSIRAGLPQKEVVKNEFDSDSINQILTATAQPSTSVPVVQIQEATPPAHPAVEPSPPAHPAMAPSPPAHPAVARSPPAHPTVAPFPPANPAMASSPAPHALPAKEVLASRFKAKKRKISQPFGKLAADIAANEIKCRNELHKTQLENEERRRDNEIKKQRILDLKEQLLLTKIEYFKSKMNS